MTRKECTTNYEKLSKLIEYKKSLAREFWNEEKQAEAVELGDYIKRLCDVRLRYIYQ